MAGGRKMGPRDVVIDVSWNIGMFLSYLTFSFYFLDIYYNYHYNDDGTAGKWAQETSALTSLGTGMFLSDLTFSFY